MKRDYKVARFIELECGDCIVRVEAWRPDSVEDGWVYVELISNQRAIYSRSLKGRLKEAWGALRGHGGFGFELFTREDIQAMVQAIQEMSREAFPTLITDAEVKRGR